MNQSLTNPSRRRLFSALLPDSPPVQATSRLARNKSIAEQFNGVFWAAEGQPDDLTIAGDDGTIFHFDGEQWQQQTLGTDLPIHAMTRTSKGHVFAVGWLGLICERSENQWQYIQGGKTTRDSQDAATIRHNLPLFDIDCGANDELWAVGDNGRVVHFDGTQWHELNCGHSNNLRSVLALDDGSVIIGGMQGLVLHYSNDKWQTLDTHSQCHIVSMTAFTPQDIYAVGGEYDGDNARFVGRIFHYDGEQWSTIETPELEVTQPLPRLRRIRQEAGALLIVGDEGCAYRITGDQMVKLATGVRYDLHDIIGSQCHEAVFCGDGGTILLESIDNNSTDTASDSPVSFTPQDDKPLNQWEIIDHGLSTKILRAVWASDDNHVFAVGDDGCILYYHNEHCQRLSPPQNIRLHGIWGTSPSNVYACGDDSTIIHFNGNEWQTVYNGNVDTALLAITGFGPHDIFVVGDEGYALRYDGLQWRKMQTGTPFELYEVWGYDSEHVLAVGGGGTIMRWNGESWQSFNAQTDNDFYGVWGDSLERIFIDGLSGALVKFSGKAWDKEFSGSRTDLHALTGRTGGPVFAVGSLGTVLRNDLSNDDELWQLEETPTELTLRALSHSKEAVYAVGSNGLLMKRAW